MNAAMPSPAMVAGPRLDKWLWAARFYKTRALATEAIVKGRVAVNGQVAKASRELRVGDLLRLNQDQATRELRVCGLSAQRGPASVAQTLYAETDDSIAARAKAAELRRLGTEPALSISEGRPTKRDRRDLGKVQVAWQRWSASLDDPDR